MPVGGAGYPKSRRLLRAREFRGVLGYARRFRSTFFSASLAQNDLGHPRLGITVSRRAAALAVTRNRIKRIARETFRKFQQRLPAVDIVVLAASSAAQGDNPTLRQDLEQLLERIAHADASARASR